MQQRNFQNPQRWGARPGGFTSDARVKLQRAESFDAEKAVSIAARGAGASAAVRVSRKSSSHRQRGNTCAASVLSVSLAVEKILRYLI